MFRYLICGFFVATCGVASIRAADEPLVLNLRSRTETAAGSGRFHAVAEDTKWAPAETAIVVCDMWDDHWCKGAASRVAEMAPRMNEVLAAARRRGVLILHCPSECMKFYEGSPQRKVADAAPRVETTRPIERWRVIDEGRGEAPLPIDDRDGGCDCQPACRHGAPWKRQIAALEIAPEDAITDNAQAYYLMKQRKIKNVIVMGVHANICVLGRPFAIRQLATQGMNVALMRDMTDTMYNSRQKPVVSHFSGTDLVIEHIERYWCPTLISDDFTKKGEFRFAADKRRHAAIVMAEDEYETNRTLPTFAAERLRKDFRVSLIYENEKRPNDIPGLDAIKTADVLLVSVRRRPLPKEQLDLVRAHVASGKGIVGIRTASHAFSPHRNQPPAAELATWPEFDQTILGGNYTGHHGSGATAPKTIVSVLDAAKNHPLLKNVPAGEFVSGGSLYKVSPLAKTATPLLLGTLEGKNAEPVAWTNASGKSRVFYTSLGHVDDFKQQAFNQLLDNAIRWSAEK